MTDRKIKSGRRYFFAFIIGTAIFLLIFLVSYSVSFFEFNRVANMQNDLAYEIFQDKLYYSFFNQGVCDSSSLKDISESLNFQRGIIDNLEKRFGKTNSVVLSRKKFYTLVELEHFEFIQTLNSDCNFDIPIILFFYSNNENLIDESESMGRLLDATSINNENLIIYSFDFDLNSSLIEMLKEKYNIKEPLTIVINGKTNIIRPSRINEIEKYLD